MGVQGGFVTSLPSLTGGGGKDQTIPAFFLRQQRQQQQHPQQKQQETIDKATNADATSSAMRPALSRLSHQRTKPVREQKWHGLAPW